MTFNPRDELENAMGAVSGIKITYVAGQCLATDLLDWLIGYGWTPFYEDVFAYRPLGDKDAYDWVIRPRSEWQSIYSNFEEKLAHDETASIRLYWKDTEYAGAFYFEQQTTEYGIFDILWTSWDDPTPKLEGCKWVTDQGWFLERILPVMFEKGINIEHVIGDNYY